MEDYEIYKGKQFSDLCRDIVRNSEEKKTQLDILVTDLRAMIKNLSEAVTIVPLLKDYLDAGIRNDEQLIKLASVIQKLMTNKVVDSEGGFTLTEEEKKQLMANVESVVKETSAPAPSKSADELLAEINNAKK